MRFVWISWLCFSLSGFSLAASRAPVSGDKGLVASTSPVASAAGVEILKKGGTAADAAVAVGFALAVTWPSAGNIGGGGFALVHDGKSSENFIDYRETAPGDAHPDYYVNDKGEHDPNGSRRGYRASGVPGTVAGLALLHKKYGKLPWKTLLEPAHRLAVKGFPVDAALATSLARGADLLKQNPAAAAIFLPGGQAPREGQILVQKDLGRMIKLIQDKGPDAFYKGEIAKLISQDMQKNKGSLRAEDLSAYTAAERQPLKKTWRGYEVVTAPPPSSGGGVLLEILGLIEGDKLEAMGQGSADYTHLLVEAMKIGFADRSEWYGDPDFVKSPIEKLLDPAYLKKRRSEINIAKAKTDVAPLALPNEKLETTHFTIRDAKGMLVSNTYTLNGGFGSGVVIPGTGILMNNEMDDFTSKLGASNMFGLKQGYLNRIQAKKRPLSSMTPTIVKKDGKAILALGTPGGPTIINQIVQVILNHLVFEMDIQEAVDAPRFHHQWQPDRIHFEPFGINPDTRKILEARGQVFGTTPRTFGDVQALSYDATSGQWTGGADVRYGGVVLKE